MNRLFLRGYPQLADCLFAPLVRESDSNAPIPLSSEWVLRLTWTHLARLVRIGDSWKRAFYEIECLRISWPRGCALQAVNMAESQCWRGFWRYHPMSQWV